MKILWMSNAPWAPTGYGNQTRWFVPELIRLGHETQIFAFFGHDGAPIAWNGIPVAGKSPRHPYGVDVMATYGEAMKADIIISLLDAWIFEPSTLRQQRWVPWFPVDHDPIPARVLDKVRYAFARIVYSRFAEQQVKEHGIDCLYVPHGTDTDIFKPLNSPQVDIRKQYGFPTDKFIVGMVAANKGYPTRKAFEENIRAFEMLHNLHPDTLLYLHCMTGEGFSDCLNIPQFIRTGTNLVLGRDVLLADQFVMETSGFPDPYMIGIYNSMDVMLSVSKGEGFGIPILEAQACGTPVIVGDWTSMGELCFSGWKVGKEDAVKTWTQMDSYMYTPRVDAIAARLQAAYDLRGNADYKQRARDGALAYDVHKVTDKFWKPALEGIAARITEIEEAKKRYAVPAPAPVPAPEGVEVKDITA